MIGTDELELEAQPGVDGAFVGRFGRWPVMVRTGRFEGVDAAMWSYRLLRRHARRAPTRLRARGDFGFAATGTEVIGARLFETRWPGDLTIWGAAFPGDRYVQIAFGGHAVSDEEVASGCRSIVARLEADRSAQHVAHEDPVVDAEEAAPWRPSPR